MEPSPASWLSDLEMDDYYDMLPTQCHLSSIDADDDRFLSHDIASVLQGNYFQPSLSCESHSSHNNNTCASKSLSNSSTAETSFERPSKQLKTAINNNSNWNSTISEHSSSSQLLSFENSNNLSPPNTNQFYGFDSALTPNKKELVSPSADMHYFSGQSPKGSSEYQNFESKPTQGIQRPTPHARDHIMAERKRREKLSQSFIALSALVPGLKKMDKASVLGDAIKYVKELKERLTLLEEQNKKRRVESVVIVKKSQVCGEDDSSWSEENINGVGEAETLPEVEARVSEKDVLLRIHCQKQRGVLGKILAEIQNLHLFVVNSCVLPFGDSNLDVTIIAQMGEGCSLTMKDLVKNLRVAILSLCDMDVA